MNRLVLFFLLMLFWCLLTWPGDALQWSYLQDLGTGMAVACLVIWITGAAASGGLSCWLEPKRYFWALAYAFVLAAYIVKANLEVAYRVLRPTLTIRPGIVKLKTRLSHPSARTVLSNSITLTPGTLTVDIHDDGVMMVHWIYVRSLDQEEATRQVIGRFEWFIERILE